MIIKAQLSMVSSKVEGYSSTNTLNTRESSKKAINMVMVRKISISAMRDMLGLTTMDTLMAKDKSHLEIISMKEAF